MKRLFYISLLLLPALPLWSQHSFTAVVRDSSSAESLPDITVSVKGTGRYGLSDEHGKIVLKNIPQGRQTIVFTATGYKEQVLVLDFPLKNPAEVYSISLPPDPKEIDEVIISSSRTEYRIENTPTRVEVLGSEEVKEESAIKPAHLVGLLGDVAGIQAQQTSAVSGNTDLRIQGLPGDYTQILRDGMPLFGGYSGNFTVLQIPPLDLKQIEIIKGASSTLYGGGAIAGIINVISKKPVLGQAERYLLVNQSSLNETNFNAYMSDRERKRGYTFFAAGTYQRSKDIDRDGFSDLPLTENVLLNPTFYLYPNDKNEISVGLKSMFEERKGGDMLVLRNFIDNDHQFFILNRSYRNTLTTTWDRRINERDRFYVKGTGTWFYRNISTNTFGMKAKQIAYFTETAWVGKRKKHDIVAGLNITGENFKKKQPDSTLVPDYEFQTFGLFIQDAWKIHPKFTVEAGLRTDFHNQYGTFFLPRVALLYKMSPSFTIRGGGGMGYKVPTLFNSELDERDYQVVSYAKNPPIKSEKSAGLNMDINYKKKFGDLSLAINQSFFITKIEQPLVGSRQFGMIVYYTEAKPIVTRGFESWVLISYKGLEAYLGYTLTDAQKKYDAGNPYLELSARNKFASVISYEFTPRWRACLEAAFTGKQYLENGGIAPAYPFFAGMLRHDIGRFSFVLNCENILDYRQSKKETILIPPQTNPRFKQLWAPIDGRVINLSVRVKF